MNTPQWSTSRTRRNAILRVSLPWVCNESSKVCRLVKGGWEFPRSQKFTWTLRPGHRIPWAPSQPPWEPQGTLHRRVRVLCEKCQSPRLEREEGTHLQDRREVLRRNGQFEDQARWQAPWPRAWPEGVQKPRRLSGEMVGDTLRKKKLWNWGEW